MTTAARVLMVDDDAVIRTLASALLARLPATVVEADDGPPALSLLEQDADYSLVILDLDLPSMSGRDVLAHIRATPPTSRLKVLVLTGNQAASDEEELLRAGADGFIRKPLQPLQFIESVRSALGAAFP